MMCFDVFPNAFVTACIAVFAALLLCQSAAAAEDNAAMHRGELEALRHSVKRGSPFGSASWAKTTARRLAIESTLNPIGRPRKQATGPKS